MSVGSGIEVIECLINALIDSYNEAADLTEDGTIHQFLLIEHWRWTEYQPPSSFLLRQVESLVKNTPTPQCLTSPSEYVRELKRWLNSRCTEIK